jgi:hypothetical protein
MFEGMKMTFLPRLQERAARLRNYGMGILLTLLISTVFIVPVAFTSNTVIDKISHDVLLSSILVSGVVAASDRSGEFVWIALVVLVAIVVRWMGWLSPNGPEAGIARFQLLLTPDRAASMALSRTARALATSISRILSAARTFAWYTEFAALISFRICTMLSVLGVACAPDAAVP